MGGKRTFFRPAREPDAEREAELTLGVREVLLPGIPRTTNISNETTADVSQSEACTCKYNLAVDSHGSVAPRSEFNVLIFAGGLSRSIHDRAPLNDGLRTDPTCRNVVLSIAT
jgi:hypothetical protein